MLNKLNVYNQKLQQRNTEFKGEAKGSVRYATNAVFKVYGELCGLAMLGKEAELCFTVFVSSACWGACHCLLHCSTEVFLSAPSTQGFSNVSALFNLTLYWFLWLWSLVYYIPPFRGYIYKACFGSRSVFTWHINISSFSYKVIWKKTNKNILIVFLLHFSLDIMSTLIFVIFLCLVKQMHVNYL